MRALDDVFGALEESGIEYAHFDRVMPNPSVDCVYEGAEIARSFGSDFIVAIGGGSAMDAAKAIAYLAKNDITQNKIFAGPFTGPVLPLLCVPTTAGTGSEVTPYSILTNAQAQTKMSISSPEYFPKIAFVDAFYTCELPIEISINTALDALSHAVEGMLTRRASVLSNALAKDSIARIISSGNELAAAKRGVSGITADTRWKLMSASVEAGIVIAQTGTTVVHSLGYSLTYFKNVDHGRANGLLLGAYLKVVEQHDPALCETVFRAMGCSRIDEINVFIDRLLGTRERLTNDEMEEYAQKALKSKNLSNSIVAPDLNGLKMILRDSLDCAL